jgi:hypothetical protein
MTKGGCRVDKKGMAEMTKEGERSFLPRGSL